MNTDTIPDRGHNGAPSGLLPILPLDPDAEKVAEAFKAFAANRAEPIPEDLPYDAETWFGLHKRVADFCDAAGQWKDLKVIQSAPQSERLTDFVTGARGLSKQVEDARKSAKKPHEERGRAVDKAFRPMIDKLELVLGDMKAMQQDWLTRENARIVAEKAEAERIAKAKLEAAEKAAAEAAARNDYSGAVDAEAALKEAEKAVKAASKPAAARAGSATGAGRAMSLRTQAYAEIQNMRQVFMHFEKHPKMIEVLQSLADAEIRAGNAVPGATRATREVAA